MPKVLYYLVVTLWLSLVAILPACATVPPDQATAATPAAQAAPAVQPAPADLPPTCPMMKHMQQMQQGGMQQGQDGNMEMTCPMMKQMQQMQQGGMQHGQTQSTNPVIRGYAEANMRMHRDMNITLTGDADQDFLNGMIPHHQGAIDMAKVVLAHGKDPRVKKLAQEIIKAQEKEIALMKSWLAKKGGGQAIKVKAKKAGQKTATTPAPATVPEAAPAAPAPASHEGH
jgi:uncharacterized protein (DUF305 family)